MKFYPAKSYQPRCERLFLEYKERLLKNLPDAQIEHIGASVIPNCISKGDLDIYVAAEKSQHGSVVIELEKQGFEIKQNTLRTKNLCMLEDEHVAIQLVVKGSEFEGFLFFRDALLADPKLVTEYNKLKRNCEGLMHEDYREMKSKFIKKVVSSY